MVDCEVMFGIDYTGVEALESLVEDLLTRDIEVRLARVHGTVLERLRTSGALARLGEEHLPPHRGGDRGLVRSIAGCERHPDRAEYGTCGFFIPSGG